MAEGETYQLAFPPNPKPHISMGLAFHVACAQHINNTFHASRVYVIVSNSISKTSHWKKLQEALGDKISGVRYGIKPHTPWDDVLEIVKDIREKGVDIIVTLGAGSLTDGAKIISWALANDVSTTYDLYKLTREEKTEGLKPCRIPTINIPTSLSGGEYSPFAGATDTRTHHKAGFAHPSMGAALIILDSALSISTPPNIWFSSGIRSVDHCVEALCSTDPKAGAETEKFADKGLRMLVPSLLETKKEWYDEKPRLTSMMGVIEAMKALGTGVPMGASHGIGHQLGPLGVGHGQTSCIMLPYVLKYNYKHGDAKVRNRQQKLLDIFWGEEKVAQLLQMRGLEKDEADAGDVLDGVIRALRMSRTLIGACLRRDQLDSLAENCLKDPWLKTNPVPLTEKKQVMEILEMAYGES